MESDKKNRSNSKVYVVGFIVIGCVLWIVLYVLDPLREETLELKDKTSRIPKLQRSYKEEEKNVSVLHINLKPIIEQESKTKSKLKRNLDDYIKELYQLGVSNPHELVRIVEETDPLQTSIVPDTDGCHFDANDRIDFPTMYRNQTLQDFREHKQGTFIFYQHLRYPDD